MQRADRHDARVVDDAIETPTCSANRLYGGIDVVLDRHIQPHGPDVFDSVQLVDVVLLAGARIDEMALAGESLRDRSAQAGTGPCNENSFLFGRRVDDARGQGGECQDGQQAEDGSPKHRHCVHRLSRCERSGHLALPAITVQQRFRVAVGLRRAPENQAASGLECDAGVGIRAHGPVGRVAGILLVHDARHAQHRLAYLDLVADAVQ